MMSSLLFSLKSISASPNPLHERYSTRLIPRVLCILLHL
ncbi:hypothetical protein Ccrd_024328, partial [Cynara cardunculus var. scolymus]